MNRFKKPIILCLALALFACQPSVKNVTTMLMNDAQVVVCEEGRVTEKREIKLSQLVEDFRVIRLDNRDEALFKWEWFFFSDNYLCIRQSDGPVKLFDKTGTFITNVGNIGQGPGEYNSVYDIVIDEKGGTIYIPPFAGGDIFSYDLNGQFLGQIEMKERLNKPRLSMLGDSILALVHLCFKDKGEKFTAANIHIHNSNSINYLYTDQLTTDFKDEKGEQSGYNHEIWSYRNVPEFAFMMTSTDTLYHYNSKENKINARFTLKMDAAKRKETFFILNELPHHYSAWVIGENNRFILVDKEDQEAYECNIVNDFMGNMNANPLFQDGYYFAVYEPATLKEKIEEHLSAGNCPEEQIEKLTSLKETLKENDNNILLLGKLIE